MIIDAQRETRPMGDERVLDYLKSKNFYRCIDFGGVQRPWASKHVTTYVDLVDVEGWEKRYPGMYDPYPEIFDATHIIGDCESDATWAELKKIVNRDGKFDFAISTHMVEHLLNPGRFLEMLPMVANEGYIGVPNRIFELGRGREFSDEGIQRCGLTGTYRGAFPHKWIFAIKPDKHRRGCLWAFPKLGALEMVDLGWESELMHYEPLDWGQLGFFWLNDIPVRMVTDKDIGFPDPQIGIEFYRKELGGCL